jgi:hypothetical protein
VGLTEHEKRELDAIEQHLAQEDPAFATKLSRPRWHAAGLTLLAAGVTTFSWPLTALGAAVTAIYPVKVTLHAVRDRHRLQVVHPGEKPCQNADKSYR